MTPKYQLYHCTPIENVDSIMRHGLRPPASLSMDVPFAEFIGDITQCDVVAVLEVDWLKNVPYLLDPDGPGCLQATKLIPPSAIRLVRQERRCRW